MLWLYVARSVSPYFGVSILVITVLFHTPPFSFASKVTVERTSNLRLLIVYLPSEGSNQFEHFQQTVLFGRFESTGLTVSRDGKCCGIK